jgi:Alr-MurF fusion protein
MLFLGDLLAAGGRLSGEAPTHYFSDVSYDSRLIRPGELFLALRTPRADGHDYIPAALAAGAAGVVCAWSPPATEGATIILADDPTALIQRWASYRLQEVSPTVVAITGSVGKTSTKRATSTLLSGMGATFASRQSFNSLLGLPIALARLQDDHRSAVLEFGSDRPGEIARLTALFPPHIAVVTAVGQSHLKAFGSLEGVAREKGALVEPLPPEGWAILNGDDPYVAAMREQTAAQVLTFGSGPACHLHASGVRLSLHETRFCLHWEGHPSIPHIPPSTLPDVVLPLVGEPAVSIALAAVGVALACGMALEQVVPLLARVPPVEGRLRPLPTASGATLLDDTFNASLPSVLAALRTLATLPARRRIAILGELADYGPDVQSAYREMGTLAGSAVEMLLCKGDWGHTMIQAARQSNPSLPASIIYTATGARHALPSDLGEGDLILVKGSAEARMERITASLLDPDVQTDQVLVRQEAAWHTVRIGEPERPTWAGINLDAVAHNIRRLQAIAGVPVMAVVKADAYGHGAVRVARVALASGATALAVATLSEARTLREADITAPVLILGYTPPWQAGEAVQLNVMCGVFDLDVARALSQAASAAQREATIHVKVDTGMGRLGMLPDEAGPFLHGVSQWPALRIEGLYSHFATADSSDESFARLQLQRFQQVVERVTAAGLRPPLVHMANSAALLRFPDARFDMVRPGIACYGLSPSNETPLPADLLPALSFLTRVAQVKLLPPGTALSYGGTFVTSRPSRIATLPVGYADGFRRSPPWRCVLVRGQRAPVVGRVCMDYTLIDVTDIEGVRSGDIVVLIGSQGDGCITADEVAEWLGTINYEVVSAILPRVPREVEP